MQSVRAARAGLAVPGLGSNRNAGFVLTDTVEESKSSYCFLQFSQLEILFIQEKKK